jgi:DNA-binding transcriptional LysR family regulator
MNPFEELQSFAAVVETGSFTAAAQRLDIAKSAISRRVAALEERLGVQLLRRTTRKLNLTDTGRQLYERSTQILSDLDELESTVLQQQGQVRGVLRVALPLSFGVRQMCSPIAKFCAAHPQVRFDLDLNDRRIDLVQEGMDLAIRIGKLPDSSLIARKLFDIRTVVCGSPQYLAKNGTPQTPQELPEHDCLVYGNLAEPSRWVCTDKHGKRWRVEVPQAMTASSGDFLCAAAIQGMGIAMQPTFIVGQAIARGDLVPLLTNYQWPVTPAYAVYPATRHVSFRVRKFIDHLADYFSGDLPWDKYCESC